MDEKIKDNKSNKIEKAPSTEKPTTKTSASKTPAQTKQGSKKKGKSFFEEKYQSELLKDDVKEGPSLSTGSILVDRVFCGGLREGVIEIYGPEGAGKSTFAFGIVAQASNISGGFAAYIDSEGAIMSLKYLKSIGINTENLLIFKKNNGDAVFNIIEELYQDPDCKLIVIDSVASLLSDQEYDGENSVVGTHARFMSRRVKKLLSLMNTCSGSPVVFINQIRANITTMYTKFAGESFTTTGGRALKYGANLRLEIAVKESIYTPDRARLGMKSKLKAVKSRYSIPYSEADYYIKFGRGFSKEMEIIAVCLDEGLITQSGAWFSCFDEDGKKRSFHSRWNLLDHLEKDPKLFNTLYKQIK